MFRQYYCFITVSIYCVLLLLPLAIAYHAELKPRPLFDEIASGLAMIAMTMMVLEFLLSGRFKTLSSPIGMDSIMRFHQLMGRILLLFLLIHPFLYTLPYSPDFPWDMDRSQTLKLDLLAGSTGLLAWFMLCVLVIFAIRRKNLTWTYEQWRLSHLTLSLAVITSGLLHAFEAGRYTLFTSLHLFWLAGIVVITATLLHIYIVVPAMQRKNAYRIEQLEQVTDKIWKLSLKPENNMLKFYAGQFVWLKFGDAFFNFQEHPFSISSSPQLDRLEFTIKEFGDFTSQLESLNSEQPVYVDGPHGHFTLHNRQAKGIMLIAGGIGIAPIYSILNDLADNNDPRPVTLLNCCRNEQQLVYQQDIEQLTANLNLNIIHMLSSPSDKWQGKTGRIDIDFLKDVLPESFQQWCFFICGPPTMMLCIENMLIQLGVHNKQIVSEHFSYEYKSGR